MGSLSGRVAVVTGAGQGVAQGIALADGIRANNIAPHALSPALEGWAERNPEEAAEFRETIPLGYIGDCEEDIGRAVVAIVQPALRYLTGATVPLDGGQADFG